MNNDVPVTPINPSHYRQGKWETIEIIEDYRLNFCLGNAVKYISRAGKKDPAKIKEDLEKSIWYIERTIKQCRDGQYEIQPKPTFKIDIEQYCNSLEMPKMLKAAMLQIIAFRCSHGNDPAHFTTMLSLAINHIYAHIHKSDEKA